MDGNFKKHRFDYFLPVTFGKKIVISMQRESDYVLRWSFIIRVGTNKQTFLRVEFIGSVIEWLKLRDCDQHGLGSKLTQAIRLCPREKILRRFPLLGGLLKQF